MVKINVSITHILEYVGERIRPLKEGEEVFKAGHIVLCGVDSTDKNRIKSMCLQSSALLQPPHEVSIMFLDGYKGFVSCQCSCKAGLSGFCKHVIATLIYINR